ncbi:MAG: exonuclease domain-containing protein, partial [Bacteroidota bacterium]
MYAVIDVETTGGNAQYGKITEIAIYLHDGLKVVDEFVTLINPECAIPPFITQLTGISNEMVQDAPKFYEVAKRIVEITEGNVFVAHNAGFDYNFIKWEFKRLGYHFERNTLCTVKLSRKIIPGRPSYSLGKLCGQFGIEINGRHRAGGDAFATVKLLEILMQNAKEGEFQKLLKRDVLPNRLNDHLGKEVITELPESTGVYYFFDVNGDPLYVGKSNNLRSRVTKHLAHANTKRAQDMLQRVADVQYELTGSELLALLLESEEIKRLQPIYNQKQRRASYRYGIFADLKLDGFIHFSYGKKKGLEPVVVCSSEEEARKLLYETVKSHRLCLQKSGLELIPSEPKACFHHSIKYCNGSCVGEESTDDYNDRAAAAMKTFQFDHPDFLIIDQGRNEDEVSVVKVEEGRYKGFGYADTSFGEQNLDMLKDCTTYAQDNREVGRIIQG